MTTILRIFELSILFGTVASGLFEFIGRQGHERRISNDLSAKQKYPANYKASDLKLRRYDASGLSRASNRHILE